MTLNEFRADKRLVEEARELFQTHIWRSIRSVLDEEHFYRYRAPMRNAWDAPAIVGRIEGYDSALANLDACARDLPVHIPPPEMTWGQSTQQDIQV